MKGHAGFPALSARESIFYGGCAVLIGFSVPANYCSLSGDTRLWPSAALMLIALLLFGAQMWWVRRAFPKWFLPFEFSVETKTNVSNAAFFVAFAGSFASAYYLFTYTRRMELSCGLLVLLLLPTTAAFAREMYVRRHVSALETSALRRMVVLFGVLPFLTAQSALQRYSAKPIDVACVFHAVVELLLFSMTVMLAVQWPFIFARYRRARVL